MEEKKIHPISQDDQWQKESGSTEGKTVLPVIEEHVVVSKEVVETGKVFIRKRVTEEETSINIPLIQEGYNVERLPGKKELLSEHPPIRYEGDNMIIPVVREVLVIEKRYEVLEEVHVNKTKTEVPHLQQITLLKEEVHIERKNSAH
ncbi:MAG TPA: YsnF/AvaK domain-containing protein [Flavisolibacter sp.]|jgi:uncharacterized protein (TIGR02271 family)|nr:YsnF/AvaK domain-containing protein [Flavisolibacter sp.]